MRRSIRCALTVCALLLAAGRPATAESLLYRLFLIDGSSLVSYGEFARVADRVVIAIPIGDVGESPSLQMVSIPEATVDWTRTDEYSNAVRAQRYGETRGENDYAMLTARVTEALNDIALAPDPARRLAMAREARATLARWPSQNYGYRATEVAHLTGMLDDVIAELAVAAGESSFDLSLVANTAPPPPVELLPSPTLRETIEQALVAARTTPEPGERVSLLRAIEVALKEPSRAGGWASALHDRASADLAAELKIEKSYADLSSATAAAAAARASHADVIGVRALVDDVLKADDRLGRRRPQEVSALLGLVDVRLDEARRLRLARDTWAARAEPVQAVSRDDRVVGAGFARHHPGIGEHPRARGASSSPVAASRAAPRDRPTTLWRNRRAGGARGGACVVHGGVPDGRTRRLDTPDRGIIRKHVARLGGFIGCRGRAPAARPRGRRTRQADGRTINPVITPRITRLVRVADLQSMHAFVARCAGTAEARARAVIVPTRGAAEALRRTIEDLRVASLDAAVILPDLVTRGEFYRRLHAGVPGLPPQLTEFDREVIFRRAAQDTEAQGTPAPFRLRAGLIVEVLAFYDELRRRDRTVAAFARNMVESLEPNADTDRGAERLLRLTRFLAAAFDVFEARVQATGCLDEHGLRARLLASNDGDSPVYPR